MVTMDNKIAFIFPGQGSQKVGMGKELYSQHRIARDVFDEIDSELNFNLSKVIFEGPESDLKKTENTQPALMALSVALCRVIEYESKEKFNKIAHVICGHSLGEYSALCASNILSLKNASKLLKIRGLAMQNAVSNLSTKMVAILGMDVEKVEEIISENPKNLVCEVANDNCPGQVVLSGHSKQVDLISDQCLKNGAKKSIKLNVSAPFHCKLMKSAADVMEQALKNIEFNKIEIKFVSNYDAKVYEKFDNIKELLVRQICSKVRWRESISTIKNLNVENIYEIGSGKVLSGLNKRMNFPINTGSIELMPDIDHFLENFFG